METKIYNIDFANSDAPTYLLPAKVVRALDRPDANDNLICFVGERPTLCFDEIKDFIFEYFEATIRTPDNIFIEDYDELRNDACSMFFASHAQSFYWFNLPSLEYFKHKGPSLSYSLAIFLRMICNDGKQFLVCIKQSSKLRPIILTNCDLRTFTPKKATQPAPLEWLTDEQYEILALRLELLRRDYEEWCDVECLSYERELFGNSEKFITACHDGTLLGTLLDSASNPSEYQVLQSWYQNILSLQGLGYLCGYSGKAEKILNMLKPYLDAVYDLPLPVKEDSDNE